jgi:hypothetical protein
MASISLTGRGSTTEIAATLIQEIQNSAMSCELVESIFHDFGETSIYLLVFEKYFMRNSSRASLTVSVIGHQNQVVVDAVGSGGGQGALFNFAWGAEEDFIAVVEDILRNIGFE